MANPISNNQEKERSVSSSVERQPDKQQSSREFLNASKDFLNDLSNIVEAGDTSEISEFVEGAVSETTGESKNKAPQGSGKKASSTGVEVKKEKPLPSIEIMQIQVSTKIEKEIRVLEKEAAKLMSASGSDFSPHKLNSVIAQIRSLREILANLVYSTTDAIKSLWLKYVKNVN